MADELITGLLSGSISDSSLGIVGDPVSGTLYMTSYRAMKDYFGTGGGSINTGSLLLTSSFDVFSGSYVVDSASFLSLIYAITGSGGGVNVALFNAYTASTNLQLANTYASESNYTLTSSFNVFSSSANIELVNIYASESNYTSTGSFIAYSSSTNIELLNIYASESKYVLTSSFNTFSASVSSQLTGSSVNTGSLLLTSSFDTYTSSINLQLNNIYASESNYTLTSSFLALSSSYSHDSGSFLVLIESISGSGGGVNIVSFNLYTASTNLQLVNTYASESNYLLTSSFIAFSASVASELTGSSVNTGSLLLTSSFNGYTSSTAIQISNIYASESNYTPTSSFLAFSSSVSSQLTGSSINTGSLLLTSSFNAYTSSTSTQIINVYASESNYTLTSSFNILSSSVLVSESFLGTLYSKNSWSTVTGDWTVVTASASIISNQIQISGGNQAISNTTSTNNTLFTQSLLLSAYGKTMLERWKMSVTFQVQATSSASYGLAVGLIGSNATSASFSTTGYFNMTSNTGSAGFIYVLNGLTNTTIAKSVTSLPFNLNDSITLTTERSLDTMIVSAKNNTQSGSGSSPVVLNYTYDTSFTSGNNPIMHGTGYYGIASLGGTFTITNVTVTSNERRNPNIMFIGDQYFVGYTTPFSQRIAAQVAKIYKGILVSAGGGDSTGDVINRMPEILAIAPKQVILYIGKVDIQVGVNTLVWHSNLSSSIAQMQSANIGVTVLDGIYETNTNITQLVAYVNSTFPNSIIANTYYAGQTTSGSLASDNVNITLLGSTVVANILLNTLNLSNYTQYLNNAQDDSMNPGLMNATTQIFSGSKIFANDLVINGATFGMGGGTNNLSIGANTLTSAVGTGVGNIVIGSGSGHAVNTAAYNTFLGYSVAPNNSSGFYNIGVGSNGLLALNGGYYNTGIGVFSLEGVTSGYGNVGLGFASGESVTTGSYNIFIGNQSGNNLNGGSSNITIGSFTSAVNSNKTGQLNIGNVIYGVNIYSGTAASGLPSINGSIGIGIQIPTANLHLISSSTTQACLRINSGSAPTAPNDGDIWYDGTNYRTQTSGSIQNFITAASSSAPANTGSAVLWVQVAYAGSIYKMPLYQ